MEYSDHFQSLRVLEKNSSLRDGVGNPTQAFPSTSTPSAVPFLIITLVLGSVVASARSVDLMPVSWTLYTLSSTRNAPYLRMYSSGCNRCLAAASGKPGTLFSKIQR